jgi:hypothetical protein
MADTATQDTQPVSAPLLPYEIAGTGKSVEEAANLFEELEPDEGTPTTSEPQPEPEVEEIEDEGEPGGDPDEGDEPEPEEVDGEEEDEEKPDEVVFEIEGERVTLDEIKKRGLRMADYTRKTQEVAEQRKAAEATEAAARAQRDEYAVRLAEVKKFILEATPAEPDWEEVKRTKPAEFATLWAENEMRRSDLQRVEQEQARVLEEQRSDFNKLHTAHLTAEKAKLVEAIPEWKDEGKSAKGKKALMDYAQETFGYTPDDFKHVTDHRLLVMLHKAQQFDAIQKSGKKIRDKVKVEPQPTLTPGAAKPQSQRSKTKRKEIAQRSERLARSGSVRDAAAVFEVMFDD